MTFPDKDTDKRGQCQIYLNIAEREFFGEAGGDDIFRDAGMCGRLKNFVNLTEVKSKTEDAMNIEEFREYCLSLPGVTEKMPFTALNDAYSRDVLCFYVGSKWFCYVNIVLFDRCCVKSTPEEAAELRARYEGVRPAWHMNKRMWSDVYFGSDVSDALVCRLVENSYRLVRDSLPAKERETL